MRGPAAGVQSARGGDEADRRPRRAARRDRRARAPHRTARDGRDSLGPMASLALMRSAWQRRRPLARSLAAAPCVAGHTGLCTDSDDGDHEHRPGAKAAL